MKKTFFILLILFIAFPASAVNLDYDYKIYKGLIESEADKMQLNKNGSYPVAGITSHHLPTATPLITEFYAELRRRRPDIKRFIVIGPDHFEKCKKNFSYSDSKLVTAYGYIYPDKNISSALSKMGANEDEQCFFNEHSIGVQANFIKKYFPDATINPIVLSYSSRYRNFDKLEKYLKNNKDIFLVLSLDFSHYLNQKNANRIDEITKKKIENNNSRGINLNNVDSPRGLKLIIDYAKQSKLEPEIFLHKNSAEYDGDKNYTTSYFDVFYVE